MYEIRMATKFISTEIILQIFRGNAFKLWLLLELLMYINE